MLRFDCPSCHEKLRIGDQFARRKMICPHCGVQFRAPAAAGEETAPVEQPAVSPPVTLAREETHEPADEPDDRPLATTAFSIDHDELIDMTAMVDIVFFLLIFFLVTSIDGLDSAIPMPKPDSHQAATGASAAATEPDSLEKFEADDEYVVVHITRDNRLEIEGVPLQDVQDLLRKIRELHAIPPHPNKMLVVGNGNADHGTMVSVLDAGHDAGFERVRMAVTDLNDE